MTSYRNRRLACMVVMVASALHAAGVAFAEILPVYGPKKLAPISDLIVLGTEMENGAIRIERLLKGSWPHETIHAVGIRPLTKKPSFLSEPDIKLKFTGKVVAFISLRYGTTIVYNGLYRVGSVDDRPGIFGYGQPINPGGYYIDPKPQFGDLDSLLRETEAAVKAIPAMQRKLLDRIKAGEAGHDVRFALTQITRLGDMDVITEVSKLPVTKDRPHGWFLAFYRNVHEPAAWPFVIPLYEETGKIWYLEGIGRIGHSDSIAYLQKVAANKPAAISGLTYLHETFIKRGDTKHARAVARAIFETIAAESDRVHGYFPTKAVLIALQYRLESKDENVRRRLPFHFFEGQRVTDASLSVLKDLSFLKEVTFNDTRASDAGFVHLAELKDLEVFRLFRTRFSDAGLKYLAGSTKLRVLSIHNTEVTDAGLSYLKKLTNLEDVSLFGSRVSSVRSLGKSKHLKRLVLDRTKVNDTAMADLAVFMELEYLSLLETAVSDAGVLHLKGLKRLRVLTLSGTRVTDQGLEHLQALENLQHLHLQNTRITDAGLLHLRKLKKLRSLSLKDTQVSPAGIKQLQQTLPMLRVR